MHNLIILTEPYTIERSYTYSNGNSSQFVKPLNLSSNYLSANSFHPTRTVVVLNFLPEAETHVKSLVSRFGVMEICETIKDEDAISSLAVIQYMEVTSALNALLALPDCKVCNIAINISTVKMYALYNIFTKVYIFKA